MRGGKFQPRYADEDPVALAALRDAEAEDAKRTGKAKPPARPQLAKVKLAGKKKVSGNGEKRVAVMKANRVGRSPSHRGGQRERERRVIRTWCSRRC
jgi:hypothetical protein